jgi:hypothetical protein
MMSQSRTYRQTTFASFVDAHQDLTYKVNQLRSEGPVRQSLNVPMDHGRLVALMKEIHLLSLRLMEEARKVFTLTVQKEIHRLGNLLMEESYRLLIGSNEHRLLVVELEVLYNCLRVQGEKLVSAFEGAWDVMQQLIATRSSPNSRWSSWFNRHKAEDDKTGMYRTYCNEARHYFVEAVVLTQSYTTDTIITS